MLISNHSYGFRADLIPDYYFGAYITESRDWDQIMFNAPNYLMVVAAGNDGNDNSSNGAPLNGNSSYDKLSGHATSKNNLVVANANDANIDGNGNLVSVSINSSSSEGPTDDLRIKPDITGNGTSVYSTYESSDTAYNSITGTSMASPNVAGTLLILQQHANNVNGNFMRAATLKGLALHTADDVGAVGPDAIYGWGLLNAKRAAQVITNNGNESRIEELTLTSGQTYQITVDSDGVNDLMASISWTDRAGTATTATNSSTPVLVNDLDIRVTKGGTTNTPWKLTGVNSNGTGDNNVDPYERVDVANATGTYTITVTHKGSLTGGSQNYSLIVTGLTGTPVVCNATVPTGLTIDGFGSSTASVSWDAVPGAIYDLRYRVVGSSTWTTNAVTGTSVSLTGLSSLTQYEVQVRSKCPDNSTSAYSSSVTFTTTEVQLNYCSSASTNINDEYIGRVQLNTIDNSSGGQFYTDFTNISTNLTQGNGYTITVTPTWTGTVYNEAYSVWIDYNKDGDFADVGEQVWTQSATQATPVSGSFTIPNGTATGNTRMRVSMKYNGIPTSCETFTYGEVEDYTVSLDTGAPDTTAPVITLNGASTLSLNLGDTYTEQGATATDDVDGDITANIVIGGDVVNTSVAGTYVVTYNVSDAAGNAATQVTRTVTVNPDTTAPVITLVGASIINLNVGDTYTEQGATATDDVDGDITASIVIGGDTVNTNVSGTYVVTYDVSDAAGNAATQVTRTVNVTVVVDTTAPVITLVGASTINLNVGDTYTEQGATATDDVDGDITANIVIGGDTVNTNVAGTYVVTYDVSDAAGNAATQVTRTVNVTTPSTGCTGGISTYPYSEGFENTIGAWTQSTADDINWTVDANGTPSSGTGPSSAVQGSYYIYVEASGNGTGYPNKRAIITSPCYDLSGETSATFSFKYHMYGATDMGTIDLEASNDNGATWTSIWSQSGNKGNSWLTADIDLAAYIGGSVQLRFNRVTGSTWQADIAIDDVSLTNGGSGGANTTVTLSLTFDNYPEETSWEIRDSANSIVASGGTYGSQADGSTLNINVDLPTGCYSLVMKDTYGDGMCCSYGNGSYTLTDASTTLASGGAFTSSETTSFCVGGATANANNYYVTTSNESEVYFKVHPNPVKQTLNVSVLGFEAQSYQVMNMIGQIVLKGNFTNVINVSDLEGGMYILQLNIGDKTRVKRFVKE
jgi:GEVED domain/Subtilase family/Bacterial surface protein, Ig-like domain/MAM domain, meprin/A5/mu/Secretion system C-terminal sorting domain/Fibronectin type III domain